MSSLRNRGRLRLVEMNPAPQEEERSGGSRDHAAPAMPGATESPVPGLRRARAASTPGPVIHGQASSQTISLLPDAQLVALGVQGDSLALEHLYRRHAPFAIHLATRIEGSARDVEDIVHDAFIRAFERLGDLSDASVFRAWLGAIVVHAVRSRMRRTRLMAALGMGRSAEPVDLDAIASPDASPHVRAQIAQIYALLWTLPSNDRIAWTLRAIEGHDLETVARLARCSLATAKRRISRTQRFLDEHFVEVHNEEAAAFSPETSP